MKVLCIGNVNYDVTVLMDHYPTENIKYRIPEKYECGGGPASNAAYLLGSWGVDTSFAGIVGNDREGNKIKDEFTSVGVNTNYMELSNDIETRESFIIINKENGSRTIFAVSDPKIKLTNPNIDIKAEYILIDGQEYEASLHALNNNQNAISIIDAGRYNEQTVELSKRVDYIVCSKNFAEDATNIKIDFDNPQSIMDIYRELETMFKGHIVITLESKGALYKEYNQVKLMPSIKVTQKDSTGAGDIFHGAFVYALINNYSLPDIIRISNIAGALSVEKVGGGRYSIPPLETVLKIYEENK